MQPQNYQTDFSITQQDCQQETRHHIQNISITQSNFTSTANQSHQHQFAIQNICKIIQRNYSRHFIKGLTFAFIQSLRKPQKIQYVIVKPSKKQDNINWPFRDLYHKLHKNSQELELFQFVNLCAEMIQSKFKAYLTRKRHMIAYHKAKRGKDLLQAFIKRWKAYRTYNCQKIVQIRKKVQEIQKQIDLEEQKFSNRDAKKLKGLYKYLQIYTKMFKDTFNLLMQTGMWTLQRNTKLKSLQKPSRPRSITLNQRNIQPQKEKISQRLQVKKQNMDLNFSNVSNVSNQFINHYPKQVTKRYEQLEDRPIKAAGQYNFNAIQKSEKSQQTTVNSRQNKKKVQKQQIENENDEQKQEKIKQKLKKTQQLQRRKKYDPRKAIQQQKKRKKQEEEEKKKTENNEIEREEVQNKGKKNIQNIKNQNSTQAQSSSISVKKQGQQEQKTKKTDQAKRKQIKLNPKNQSNAPEKFLKKQHQSQKQILKKVSSKVDCWTSKKQAQPQWVKEYKNRILQNRQQSQEKNTDNLRRSNQKYKEVSQKAYKSKQEEIEKQKQKEREMQIQRHRQIQIQIQKRLSRQREKQTEVNQHPDHKRIRINSQQRVQGLRNSQGWHSKQQQIESLKQKQNEFLGNRKNSTHNLHEQVRAMLDKKNNIKKREIHRSIQELEQTYSKSYGDRFQNLMPKLSLLTVARNQERENKIPVLCDYSQEFQQWFEQLYYSTQYWKIATQQEKIFKTFMSS